MKPLQKFSIMSIGPHMTMAPDFDGQWYKVIDVDPLIEAKDKEIERWENRANQVVLENRQRISELQAENKHLRERFFDEGSKST